MALAKPHFTEPGRKAKQVSLSLSGQAKAQLADNLNFNQGTLLYAIRRALEAKGLLGAEADHALPTIEVLITDVRARSAFSAIMFGFMAGDDRIKGEVVVRSPNGGALQQFSVVVSYALGGIGGGRDDARMGWLYESFARRVVEELMGSLKS